MEETIETELTKVKEYLYDELKRIGCEYISIITFPDGTLEYPIKSNRDPAIQLDFTKDGDRYIVIITKHIDQNWNNRLDVKVQLTRTFNEREMILLSSLSVQDTLTVIRQSEEDGTELRLVHRVYDSFTCKAPCDANVATEIIEHIFEISKL